MKTYNFIAYYYDLNSNEQLTPIVFEVKAFTFKGARTKALNKAQAFLRELDAEGAYAAMRLCKV